MTFIKLITQEKCPVCHETLITNKSNVLLSHIIKTCPKNHYEKEFIPSLEGYVEHYSTPTK
nr:hypothetical protein [Paenibacillus aestuarii]